VDLLLSGALIRLADAVGSARDLTDLCDAALAAIVDITGIERASVLLFDPDGVMRFKAWRGLSDAYRAAVEGHTPWSPGQPPPDPIIVADVTADPSLAVYRERFEAEQIAAVAFVPIISRRQVVGKFMLYRRTAGRFTDRQVAATLNVGYHIGFAVVTTQAMREQTLARERLAMLTEASQKLLATPTVQSVADEVLALAKRVVAADGYAIWRRKGDLWRAVASQGISAAFTQSVKATSDPFDAPVVASDVSRTPVLDARRAAYASEGIASLLSIPLSIRGATAGSVVFYYRTPHTPPEMDVHVAMALGHLAAAALSSAEIQAEQQRQRREAQDAEMRAAFLADASVLLSSLDYQRNLGRIAELMVPRLADWCAVDLMTEHGLARLAVAHVDPDKVAFARDLEARYPTDLEAPTGVGHVLRSGQAEIFPEITDEMLAAGARSPEHLALMRELSLQSAMMVPLSARHRTFGVLSFVTTAGGRRYTEADLEFAKELARRAAFAIENARLYAEAHEANRLKDEFLATLSHELRTPLNVILGRIRMLNGAIARPDAFDQLVSTIDRNAQSLARLVEDLLDVSRISLGQVKVDSQPVSLKTIVDTVVTGLEPAARAKGVAVTVAHGPVRPLLGDGTRLQQVVWNLLTNAIKFTPSGGRVTISLQEQEGYAALSVSDTGEGIAAEFLPHVFEMFRQAEPANTRRYGGLGIGLSIVRRLVELHGGTIAAESAGPGCGATFRVLLPLAVMPVEA
jgi:signal transduction histidine kinase